MNNTPLVSIVMGSDSDLDIMNEAAKALAEFGIPYEIDITSAHRSPARTSEYSRGLKGARRKGCHRRRGRSSSSGRRHRRRNHAAGHRRAHSFHRAARPRLTAGDGADAGRNSRGDSRHRQAGRYQCRHSRRADDRLVRRGRGEEARGSQREAGQRRGSEVDAS